MGIDRKDFEGMVRRVVAGRERKLHNPESQTAKPLTQPVADTKHLAYNVEIVKAFFASYQIPEPCFEFYFCESRLFRFDLAWLDSRVAMEVQGGIWNRGGHVRGVLLKREWEKLNLAAGLGWRLLFCEPDDLLTAATARAVKTAIFYKER
jgi:hypothetical protein